MPGMLIIRSKRLRDKDDYTEKQAFLNTVYEPFFQGFSPKEADTRGIVYTPQPIVVERMLIQHLFTERIFARVFKNTDFRNKNVIATEIEKVIQSMTSRHFSRDQFLSGLDHFYKAIERAADDRELCTGHH